MTLRVSGKNLDIGEALRSQVQDRVAGALSKYFDGGYSGHVTVTRDGTGYRTAGRIENRLRRYKQRLKGRSGPASGRAGNSLEMAYSVLEAPSDEAVEDEVYHPMVIAETTKPLHKLSVSDAVMQLDLSGAAALVFIHASTGRVNVVYRRGDGAIGWVDPPLAQP